MSATMLVKNTFLELYSDTAAATHQPRRRSLPPSCREGMLAHDEAVDERIQAQLRRLERTWLRGTVKELPLPSKKRSSEDCSLSSCASTCGDFDGSPVGCDFSRVTTAEEVVDVQPEGGEDPEADAETPQNMSPLRGSDADEDFPASRFGGAPPAGRAQREVTGAAARRARRRRRAARKASTASVPESEEPPMESTLAVTHVVRVVAPAAAVPPPPPTMMAPAPRSEARPGLRAGESDATNVRPGGARGAAAAPAAGPPELMTPPARASVAGEDAADLQELLALVPLDDQGRLTSIGAMEHAAGTCKPCIFFASPLTCKFGATCSFCHFPVVHARVRVRFCKGKRERCRKLLGMDATASASTETTTGAASAA